MDGKRGPSEEREESGPGAAPPTEPPQAERFGPLQVTRLRKEDGRALIVYSHTAPADAPESGPEPAPA